MEFEHVDVGCDCDGKQCKDCGEVRCIGDFPIRNRKGYRSRYCRPCLNQRKYAWAAANKDKVRESRKKIRRDYHRPGYYKGNEYIRQIKIRNAKKWNEAHPERMREWKMSWKMKKYNISADEYTALLESQGGVCAICHKPETVKSRHGKVQNLAIDHDHITGKVRGLLCFRCNTTLGVWEKNADAFISYLSQTDSSCSE